MKKYSDITLRNYAYKIRSVTKDQLKLFFKDHEINGLRSERVHLALEDIRRARNIYDPRHSQAIDKGLL